MQKNLKYLLKLDDEEKVNNLLSSISWKNKLESKQKLFLCFHSRTMRLPILNKFLVENGIAVKCCYSNKIS